MSKKETDTEKKEGPEIIDTKKDYLKLGVNTINAILANLQEQPYKNVAGLVSMIQQDIQTRNS